ncbi:FecR family protein [Spirosoma arcticum]
MDTPIHKQTVFDHFSGRTSPLQQQLLADWLRVPANQHQYYAWLEEWEQASMQVSVDEQDAHGRLLQRLNATSRTTRPSPIFNRSIFPFSRYLYGIAAVISGLFFLFTGLYYTRSAPFFLTIQTVNGEVRSLKLADGSTVMLNANSELTVPRWGHREAWLRGEAAFTVTHLPGHPRFVVHTPNQFDVEVLGTRFVLYARARKSRIMLQQGKVKLQYQSGKQLYIKPGELATLPTPTAKLTLTKTTQPQTYTAWEQKRFFFDNTTLPDVCQQINEQFGVTVVGTDSTLVKRRISGYFKAERVDQMLQDLEVLLNVRAVHHDQSIELIPVQ